MEEWRDIEGYEGLYQVSNFGRVKSLERKVSYIRGGKEITRKVRGMILKPIIITGGYQAVNLHKNGVKNLQKIHRLVCMAFIPISNPQQMTVNHINRDKTDNRLENLEWMTGEENTSLASYQDWGKKYGLYNKNGELVGTFTSFDSIAKYIGCGRAAPQTWYKGLHKSKDGWEVKCLT